VSLYAVLACGSVLLASMQLASSLLLKNHMKSGWVIVLVMNVAGLWYDWHTRQVGYLGLAAFNIPVAFLAWRKWGREVDLKALVAEILNSPEVVTYAPPASRADWLRRAGIEAAS